MNRYSVLKDAKRLMARANEINAVKRGAFTLANGETSDMYFDGRVLTTDPEGSCLISNIFVDILRKYGVRCFGGPATGALPLLGGIALRSYQVGHSIRCFYTRSAPKQHGIQQIIEGCEIIPNEPVVIWDDTVSTGASLVHMKQVLSSKTDNVPFALCIVRRSDDLMLDTKVFSLFILDEALAGKRE